MLRAAAVLVLAFALSACDVVSTLREGMQEAKAVETDLEQATGSKPEVGFNWHNGRLALVTVQFPQPYEARPLGELATLTRAAVVKEFKQTPDKIVLAFALAQ